MKRFAILFLCAMVLIFGLTWFALTLRAASEQRQQRIEQEIEERINSMREECRLQYPHDIYMRAKCYQKMMANV